MKDFSTKFKLLKWHFYLLGLLSLNFVIEAITNYRLNQNLIFLLIIVLYLTGVFLFFKVLKPFKLITVYFLFYVVSVVSIGFFFLLGGILLAILSSILLYPINPKQTKYENEKIRIYTRFQGFMGPCCPYEVVKPQLYIFEKHLGYINIEQPIDTTKDEFTFINNQIIYKHQLNDYKYNQQTVIKKDTIEIIDLK